MFHTEMRNWPKPLAVISSESIWVIREGLAMKSKIIPAILASIFCLGPGSAFADSHGMTTMQLAEEKKCTACHTLSESEVMAIAPSFQSIAQRYSMDESGRLVQVVLTGGEGHWSKAEMPDMGVRTDVSRKDAEKLVKWILEMEE
jgi:cytochrome c